jgi:N-acetylneuraminic acid mutarotase
MQRAEPANALNDFVKPINMRHTLHLFLFSLSILVAVTSCHKSSGLPSSELGSWAAAANFPGHPRSFAVSFVIGDTAAYVGLGYNENVQTNNGQLNDFYVFNPHYSSDTSVGGWAQVESFPGAPRSNAVGFNLGNYGYVGTGWDGNATLYNDFYQYDPIKNQWAIKASFPGAARFGAVGFGLQGKGYIGTGFSTTPLSDFYQYDPQANSWANTPVPSGGQSSPSDAFSARTGAVTFLYNNKAYLVSGMSLDGSMAVDFWVFDPSQQGQLPPQFGWLRLRDIVNDNLGYDDLYTGITREYAVGFVNGNQAYLVTGSAGDVPAHPGPDYLPGPLASAWSYNFAADIWSQLAPITPQGRYGAVAFTVNGKSYVGSGYNGSFTVSDFSEFLPTVKSID